MVVLDQARELVRRRAEFMNGLEKLRESILVSTPYLRAYGAEIAELRIQEFSVDAREGVASVSAYYDGGRDEHSWHGAVENCLPCSLGFDT